MGGWGGAQGRRSNREPREGETGTATHQKTTGQVHGRRQAGSQAQQESPQQGLDVQNPGWPGDPSRASRCVFAVHISSVMLKCNLWKTTSAEAMLRLRAMDLLRERKTGQRVGMRSPIGTPHNGGCRRYSGEEGQAGGGHDVRVCLHPGLSAVGASLRGVRGTYSHVQCRVGIAQGRGERTSAGLKSVPGMRPGTLHL